VKIINPYMYKNTKQNSKLCHSYCSTTFKQNKVFFWPSGLLSWKKSTSLIYATGFLRCPTFYFIIWAHFWFCIKSFNWFSRGRKLAILIQFQTRVGQFMAIKIPLFSSIAHVCSFRLRLPSLLKVTMSNALCWNRWGPSSWIFVTLFSSVVTEDIF